MTLAELMLLGFALWTILVPLGAVGIYRFHRIAAGAAMNAFPSDDVRGPDWYHRAMRAHANCVENLPVFAVLVLLASRVLGPNVAVDVLATAVFGFRIAQTLVHLSVPQSARVVAVRFSLFLAQVLAMLGIAARLVGLL